MEQAVCRNKRMNERKRGFQYINQGHGILKKSLKTIDCRGKYAIEDLLYSCRYIPFLVGTEKGSWRP